MKESTHARDRMATVRAKAQRRPGQKGDGKVSDTVSRSAAGIFRDRGSKPVNNSNDARSSERRTFTPSVREQEGRGRWSDFIVSRAETKDIWGDPIPERPVSVTDFLYGAAFTTLVLLIGWLAGRYSL